MRHNGYFTSLANSVIDGMEEFSICCVIRIAHYVKEITGRNAADVYG